MRSRKKGFTLFEVLITLVLLAVGLSLLLEAMAMGLFGAGINENELIAINLAREKIEEIRNTIYSNIGNEAKATVAGFPAFNREVVVTLPQAGLKTVNVTVSWFVKSDEINASFVTYASDI